MKSIESGHSGSQKTFRRTIKLTNNPSNSHTELKLNAKIVSSDKSNGSSKASRDVDRDNIIPSLFDKKANGKKNRSNNAKADQMNTYQDSIRHTMDIQVKRIRKERSFGEKDVISLKATLGGSHHKSMRPLSSKIDMRKGLIRLS